jgi:hypothetical protein
MGAQGVAGPVGPTGPAGVSSALFVSGFGQATVPSGTVASDIVFLSGQVSVVVAAGQKVFVTSTATLGAGGTAASGLNLWICSKLSSATDLTPTGAGTFGLSTPANTRNHYSLSAVLTGLAPGTYTVGICGYTTELTSHWNNNEWGYTSTLLLQ